MIDPTIKALTSAIAQAETGQSSPQAYTKRGASGEYGRYQFMPDTWQAYASEAGVTTPLEQATIEDQNKVAYSKIAKWKAEGYNPAQIASMWNAGPGKPNAYKEGWKGVNEKGVAYDTPAYAQKVSQYYLQQKQNIPEAVAQGPVQPEEPKEGLFKSLVKDVVTPFATRLARPIQALQSGIQYAATDWKGMEAEAKKYNDEAYRLSQLLKTTPDGYQKDQLKAQIQAQLALGKQVTDRLGKAANWKPSTNEYIAPIQDTLGGELKQVGTDVTKIGSFALTPAAGGALWMGADSVENGNDLLSFQTALNVLYGAAGGKVADIIGRPLLGAVGKYMGPITPQILKDVAKGGTIAVQQFMERNKLLPDVISKPLNTGATKLGNALDTGFNAPFDAAGRGVKAPFVQNDAKVVTARERALQDLEEKYAQLRANAARDPKGTAATRGRVARSNVLTEEGMINEDGVIIGASRASEAYEAEAIGQGNRVVRQLLDREGVAMDLNVVQKEMERVMRETFDGAELTKALKQVQREIDGLRIKRPNGRITLSELHDNKISSRPKGKDYDDPSKAKMKKAVSRTYRETIEKNSKENIGEINKELQKFYDDIEYIANLQGKRIESGKLGKAVARIGGALGGAVVGGAIGGLPGVAAGSYVGGIVSSKLAGRSLSKAFGKPTKLVTPKSKVIGEAVEKANAPRNQLALPAPSGKTPIPLQPPKGKPSLGAVKAQSYVDRDPKTGRFRKVFLSSDAPQLPSKVAEKAYENTVTNGGITISLKGDTPVKGLAYAPFKGTEQVIPKKDFTPKHLDTYIDDHFDELSQPGNHLGTWEFEGNIYMDVSKVGPNTPETKELAVAANQLGVFDLESFETIELGKLQDGRYIRTYAKETNLSDFNGGQNKGANKGGGDGELPEVRGGTQSVSAGGVGKVGEGKVGGGEVGGAELLDEIQMSIPVSIKNEIKTQRFIRKKVMIDELLKNDLDLADFVKTNKVKATSEQSNPVIIGKWQGKENSVMDGWHKIARLKKAGVNEVDAYVAVGGVGKVGEIGKTEKIKYKQFGKQLRKQIRRDLISDKSKAVVIDSDTIKKAHPDYDPNKPNLLHDESSALSKELTKKAVDEDTTGLFRMTGGGAGSGKSEAVLRRIKSQPSVIFDGVLGNPKSAIEKIDYALAKGMRVEIYPVYTPIELATLFNKLRKRSVPDEDLVIGHYGFRDTIPQLIAKYGNKIKVKPYENTGFGVKPRKLSQKRWEAKEIANNKKMSKAEVEKANAEMNELIEINGLDWTKSHINDILKKKYG